MARWTWRSRLSKGEQDLLNPIGVNCVRAFPGRGIRIWGARTLSSDPAWRYLNVRRLFNYLEESILLGTQWVVFEPNDDRLWSSIRRNVTAFLTEEWRRGALFGRTVDGGVLRQVRPGQQPAGVHRPRPGGLRDRGGAGEAGGVRGVPAGPVLRQHQPRRRVTRRFRHLARQKGDRQSWQRATLFPPTSSACSSAAITVESIQEVSGLTVEEEVVEVRQVSAEGKQIIRKQPGARKAGEVTITRGLDQSSEFTEWIKETLNNGAVDTARQNLTIEIKDTQGTTVRRIQLMKAGRANGRARP